MEIIMSLISDMVQMLKRYFALPHHQDPALADALRQIQAWQRARIHRANHALFTNPKTAPLAHYIIDRIYSDTAFDVLAEQLLTAGNNALNGSGKLEKLIPKNTLATGLMGVSATCDAIELDLALAKVYVAHHQGTPIDDALMIRLYQAGNDKAERIRQIRHISDVCHASYQQFNSFLLQKAFKLAKSTAYSNGYQPLYDFIHDGLQAIAAIDKIDNFSVPFVATELDIIERIYDDKPIYDTSA